MRLGRRSKDVRRRPIYTKQDLNQAKVFSYYSSPASNPRQDGQLSPRRQVAGAGTKKSRIQMYAKLLVLSAFLFLLTATTYINTSSARVVEDGVVVLLKDSARYEESLKQILSEDLKNKNKLTVDISHVTEEFIKRHPEVASAKLSFNAIGSMPILHIIGHEPALILDRPLQGKYVLNKQGRVVAEITGDSSTSQDDTQGVPVLEDRSGVEVEVGKNYIASEEVYFILRIFRQSEATALRIGHLLLPPLSRELHVRFLNLPNLYVKFYTGGDADLQFGSFRAVADRISEGSIEANEYIDVRVAGRAFVK